MILKRVLWLAVAALVLSAGVAAAGQQEFVLTNGSGTNKFTVKKGGQALPTATNVSQDSALKVIRWYAIGGDAVQIQFGEGVSRPLDMGDYTLRFDRLETDEGQNLNFTKLTLTGDLKSNSYYSISFSGSSSNGVTEEVRVEKRRRLVRQRRENGNNGDGGADIGYVACY